MKKLTLKAKLSALTMVIGFGAFMAPAASAYTVYTLANNYYAIVCTDGQIFSYSGSAGGVGIVAPALCEGHGGIAGGNGGGPTPVKATAELERTAKSCVGGKKIDAKTTQCKTRIRVNRIEMKSSVSSPDVVSPRDAASGLPTGKR